MIFLVNNNSKVSEIIKGEDHKKTKDKSAVKTQISNRIVPQRAHKNISTQSLQTHHQTFHKHHNK